MQKLDPITGLPQETARDRHDLANSLKKLSSATPTGVLPSPVQGAWGDYKTPVTSDRDFNEYRAQNQGAWELIGKATANTVGGIIAGGLVSAAGFIADIPQYVSNFVADLPGDITHEDGVNREGRRGQNFERNQLSRWGHEIENYFFENFEVYQTERAQSGGLNPFSSASRTRDATFWASNFPSVFSSVTLMLPAFAGSAAIRGLARLGNIGRTATGARGVQATDVLFSSFLSRHNYNMMEGYELMDRQMEHYLEQGKSYSEAKELASKDSGRFYTTGYLNMWKDVIQWGALLRGANYASRVATDNLRRTAEQSGTQFGRSLANNLNQRRSMADVIRQSPYNKGDILLQAGLEGFEEFNIQFQKNWSARNADILSGIEEGDVKGFFESYFSGDFVDELGNIETQNAMLMAFLGGPVIQGVGQLANYRDRRSQAIATEQAATQITNQLNYVQEKLQEIQNFSAVGNNTAALKSQHELVTHLALSGLLKADGTFHANVSDSSLQEKRVMFEGIQGLTSEQLTELGLTEESKDIAKWVLNEINEIEQIYQKNSKRDYKTSINDVIAVYMTEQEYLNKKYSERKDLADSKIESIFSDSAIEAAIKSNNVQDINNIKRDGRLFNLKRLKKQREAEFVKKVSSTPTNVLRHKMIERRHKETMSWIDSEIESLEADKKENPTSTESQSIINKHIKNHSTWNDLNTQSLIEEIGLREGEADLAEYGTPDFEKEYLQARELSNEKLKSRIDGFFYKSAIQDGRIVRHDDKLYQVSHGEEGSVLKEYNRETNALTGEQIPMTSEIFESSVYGKPSLKVEDLVTQEKKDDLIKELEKNLKNEEYGDYLKNLERLWLSGFDSETSKARIQLQNDASKKLTEIGTLKGVEYFSNFIEANLHDENLKKSFRDLANKRIAEIKEAYDKEIAILNKATAPTIKELQAINSKLSGIETSLSNLEKIFLEFESDQKHNEIQEAVQKLIAERSKLLNEQEVDAHAEIRQRYEKKIQDAVLGIISKDSIQAETAKKLLNDYKSKRDSLVKTRNNLLETKKDVEKRLAIYEKIKEDYIKRFDLQGDQITAILLTKEEIANLVNESDIDTIEALIKGGIEDLNISEGIDQTVQDINTAIESINSFISRLEQSVELNDFIKQAMINSYKRLLSEGANIVVTDTIGQDLFDKYKKYFAQELTSLKPSEKLNTEQNKILKSVRQRIYRSQDYTSVRYMDTAGSEIITMLSEDISKFKNDINELSSTWSTNLNDNLFKLDSLIQFYNILKNVKYKKKDGVSTEGFDDNPIKRLMHVFITTAGDTYQNADNARYTRFVNNINLFENNVELQIIRPETLGIELQLSEEDIQRYGKNNLYMVAVTKNDEGDILYYKENGETTKEFSKEESIFTSLPHPNSKIEILESLPELESYYRKKHQEWIDDILPAIDQGETITVPVTEKSRGVVPNRVSDRNQMKPFTEIIKEDVSLHIAYDGSITVDGIKMSAPKGSVVAFSKDTGNQYEVVTPYISHDQANTILQFLKEYAESVQITNRGPQWQSGVFSLNTDVGSLTVSSLMNIKSEFASKELVDFNFKNNTLKIGESSFQILKTDVSGNYLNELANPNEILEALTITPANISSANMSKEVTPIRYKDGKWVKEAPVQYETYALNNLALTPMSSQDKLLNTADGLRVPNPILHNQQFRFEHGTIPQEGFKEVPKEKGPKKEAKGLISNKQYNDFLKGKDSPTKDLFKQLMKKSILGENFVGHEKRVFDLVKTGLVKDGKQEVLQALIDEITAEIEGEGVGESTPPVPTPPSLEELGNEIESLKRKSSGKREGRGRRGREDFDNKASISDQKRNVQDNQIRDKYFADSDTQKTSTVLKKIAESNHPLAPLAKQLSEYITEDFDIILTNNILHNGSFVAGLWQAHDRSILIDEYAFFRGLGAEPTILHEILHGLSTDIIEDFNNPLTKDLLVLFDYAQDNLSEDFYGLTNPTEFLSEMFTNAEFIEALKSIPAKEGVTEYKNLFEQILDYILGLFGINRSQKSLYTQSTAVASQIVATQSKFAESRQKSFAQFQERQYASPQAELGKYELFPGVFANAEQKEAIDTLGEFFSGETKEQFATLKGRGGTGKTTIIKKVLSELKLSRRNSRGELIEHPATESLGTTVGLIAPTHKARFVLGQSMKDVYGGEPPTLTLASALGIDLDESTGKFKLNEFKRNRDGVKISKFKYIIIDEGSMIKDNLFQQIQNDIQSGAKVLFMGDNVQLPPVGQQKDSKIFQHTKVELMERMRQTDDSPIVPVTDTVANNVESKSPQKRVIENRENKYDAEENSGIIFEQSENVMFQLWEKDFKANPKSTRIVTFNNERYDKSSQSVKNINIKAREILYPNAKEDFVEGEQVVAYDQFGDDDYILLYNSMDYTVKESTPVQNKKVDVIAESRNKGRRIHTFDNLSGYNMILTNNTTGKDTPSIFVPSVDSKNNIQKIQSEYWKKDPQMGVKIGQAFPNLVHGYAITSHKAQGSTYRNVYVLEDNILGGTNRTNKEMNQSLYVALSRASDKLVIQSRENSVTNEELVQDNPSQKSHLDVESLSLEESAPEIEVVKRYSNKDVKNNPDKIYVFGDNVKRTGKGGQAQIRNNSNAFGIATKLKPSNKEDAFMSDSNLESNKKIIDSDIQNIIDQNKPLVFPEDGLGTGLAKLKEKAPETYSYLKQRLLDEFGFNNDTGQIVSKDNTQPPWEENNTNNPTWEADVSIKRSPVVLKSNSLLPGKDSKFTESSLQFFNDSFFHILNTDYAHRIGDLFDQSNEANVNLYYNIINDIRDDIADHYDYLVTKAEEYKNKGDIEKTTQYVQAAKNVDFIRNGSGEFNNMQINIFDRLVMLHQDYLRRFGLEASNTQENLNAEQSAKDSSEIWHIESLKYSFKDTATSSTKMLFQNLFDTVNDQMNEEFMIQRFIDPGKMFAIVGNLVASSPNADAIISKLIENKNSINGLEQLVEQSGIEASFSELSTSEFNRILELLQTLTRHNNKYYFSEIGEDGKINIIDGVVNTQQKMRLSEWLSNSNKKGINKSSVFGIQVMKVEDGKLVYNTDSFKELLSKYKDVASLVESISENHFTNEQKQFIKDTNNHSTKNAYRTYFKYNILLNDLFGIDIRTNKRPSSKYYNSIQSIVNGIAKGESNRNILGRETDYSGYFKEIINHELQNTENLVDTNYFNFENETQYTLQYNSFLTHTENNINNSETKEDLILRSRHLASDYSSDQTGGSLLLNKMLYDKKTGKKKNSYEMKFMEGLKSDSKGTSFSKLGLADKVLFSLSGSILDVHSIFRASDNSLERVYDGLNFNDYISNHADLFTDYLQNEINYFRDMSQGDEYKGMRNLGLSHSMFGEIIELGNLQEEYNEIINGKGILTSEFKSTFRDSFDKYVNQKVNESFDFIEQLMIVKKIPNKDRYANNGLVGLTKENIFEFNKSQILNILKKALLNRAVWNVEQTKLFTGHPAAYGDTDKFYQRMSGMVGTKETSLVTPTIMHAIENHYPRNNQQRNYWTPDGITNQIPKSDNFEFVYKVLLFDDVMVSSKAINEIKIANKDAYDNMNEGDAIAMMPLESYRDMLITNAKWSDAFERLYQWEIHGGQGELRIDDGTETGRIIRDRSELRNTDGKLTRFPSIKPQAFGATPDSRFVPEMYKLSVIPLLPSVVNSGKYPNMKHVHDYMQGENADILTFPSANKIGSKAVSGQLPSLYKDGYPNMTEAIEQFSFAKNWGIQLDTGSSSKIDKKIVGTQAPKVIVQNTYEKGKITSKPLAKAVEQFESYKEALIDHEVENIRKSFDVSDEKGIKRMVQTLLRETNRRNPTNNVIDSIESLPDNFKEGFGVDILSNKDKIEQIVMALANERAIRNPVRGTMYVQAPSTLWEGDVRKYSDDGIQLLSNDLEFNPLEGSMEIYVPHSFKEFVGKDLSIENIPSELLETVGFRIPTSGLNSIVRLKIKDFLPDTYGDVIILPSEIVAMSGSDFDVDKLSVFLSNYVAEYNDVTYNMARDFLWNELQGANPKETLLNIYERFLEDEDGTEGVHLSYPNDFEWTAQSIEDVKQDLRTAMMDITEVLHEKLFKGNSMLALKFQKMYELDTPTIKYIEPGFDSRKAMENGLIHSMIEILKHADRSNHLTPIGISMFKKANQNITPHIPNAVGKGNNSMLTFDLVYQELVKERNMTSKNLIGIEALQIVDHSFSQKHNYFFSEQHQLYFEEGTYNTYGGLVSLAGLRDAEGGELITEALNQSAQASVDGAKNPIFFNLNFNFETSPVINYLIRAGVPFQKIMVFINQPIIRRYAELEMIRKSKTNEINEFLTTNEINRIISEEFGSSKTNDVVSWSQMEYELENNVRKSSNQRKILEDYKHYVETAQVITDYITATRIDSDLAKNTSAIDLKVKSIERIIKNPIIQNSDKVFTEGYLAPFYNALTSIQDIYSPLFTNYNFKDSSYGQAYNKMLDYMFTNKFRYVSQNEKIKLLENFKLDFISAILINNPISIYDGSHYGTLREMITDLMTGEDSIGRQLEKYKEESSNPFVEAITPIIGHEYVDFRGQSIKMDNVKMFNQKIPPDESNRLTDGWRELFSDNPTLAKGLAAVTILQSGLKLSPMTFTKLIPSEIYKDMFVSTFDYMDSNINLIQADKFIASYFVNNYRNNDLVPTAYYTTGKDGLPYIKGSNNPIYKIYEYLDSYKKLSPEDKKLWNDTKKSNKKSTPTIYVNRLSDLKSLNIFNFHPFENKGVYKIHLQGIQDFGNSQSLLGYFDPIVPYKAFEKSNIEVVYKERSKEDHLESLTQIHEC